jgi:hypothetical protein
MRTLCFWLTTLCAVAAASMAGTAIVVTISLTVRGIDEPLIMGETNLPDGTVVLVTLSRIDDGYARELTTSVKKGAFEAGPFGEYGLPLDDGLYDIKITIPVPWSQPKSVLAVIGRNGENLQGPLVKRSASLGMPVVEYHQRLPIGDPSAAERDRKRLEKEDKRLHGWERENNCRATCDQAKSESEEIYRWFDLEACYSQCRRE